MELAVCILLVVSTAAQMGETTNTTFLLGMETEG
jgi:hypothetical protein